MNKKTESRLEQLFKALLEGGSTAELEKEWDSLNRLEQYLICVINKAGIERMGEPINRLEILLQALYNKNN